MKKIIPVGLSLVAISISCYAAAAQAPVRITFAAGATSQIQQASSADLTRSTGRYNLAQGYAGTAVGIGAALSVAGSGFLVEHGGYAASFLALAAIGLAGFAMLYKLLPETKPGGTDFTWARLLHYRKASA